jgi:hypothetical protein
MPAVSVDRTLKSQLRSIVYLLSLILLFTSMIDLFVNRLMFRAGPEVLSHVALPTFYLALIGRVSITLEQFLLFPVLAFAATLLFHEAEKIPRVLSALLAVIVACSALLYAPLAAAQAWAVSTLLVLVSAVTIFGLAGLRIRRNRALSAKQRLVEVLFLFSLVLGFIFPLYYRLYLLVGAAGLALLPAPLEAYVAGICSIMFAAFTVFAYALLTPSPGFTLGYRDFAKAAVLPTLLVVPVLYEAMRSFFVAQIITLVVVMSTDFAVSHDLLRVLIVLWWFFLTAVLVLFLKGHYSENKKLQQEAIGLVLIMSTSFLFDYPYYLMLGIAGVFLLCYPS